MKSKLDIYIILTNEGQMYLPPINDCPIEFIHGIINGTKKVFKNSELKIIDVPYFEELSAKSIQSQIENKARFTHYLPYIIYGQKLFNREYLFNVSRLIANIPTTGHQHHR